MEFEKLFIETKGQPITYQGKELKMVDRINLPSGNVALKVRFVSTDSKWKQGIVLQTKGDFNVNGQKLPAKIILWEHTAPKEVQVVVKSKDKVLVAYNVWIREMEKDKTILLFIEKLRSILNFSLIQIVDYWDSDLCAIGLKKENRLIYIYQHTTMLKIKN